MGNVSQQNSCCGFKKIISFFSESLTKLWIRLRLEIYLASIESKSDNSCSPPYRVSGIIQSANGRYIYPNESKESSPAKRSEPSARDKVHQTPNYLTTPPKATASKDPNGSPKSLQSKSMGQPALVSETYEILSMSRASHIANNKDSNALSYGAHEYCFAYRTNITDRLKQALDNQANYSPLFAKLKDSNTTANTSQPAKISSWPMIGQSQLAGISLKENAFATYKDQIKEHQIKSSNGFPALPSILSSYGKYAANLENTQQGQSFSLPKINDISFGRYAIPDNLYSARKSLMPNWLERLDSNKSSQGSSVTTNLNSTKTLPAKKPEVSPELKARLDIEQAILTKYAPLFHVYLNDGNPYCQGWYTTAGGNRYQIRLQLTSKYPTERPRLYVTDPVTLWTYGRKHKINDLGVSMDFYCLGTGPNGCIELYHSDAATWTTSGKCKDVLISAMRWLESYERHLETGESLADLIKIRETLSGDGVEYPKFNSHTPYTNGSISSEPARFRMITNNLNEGDEIGESFGI